MQNAGIMLGPDRQNAATELAHSPEKECVLVDRCAARPLHNSAAVTFVHTVPQAATGELTIEQAVAESLDRSLELLAGRLNAPETPSV